jgi:antitoxin FitA
MGLIQIRNVPDDVHRTLKARAATRGTSLSEYVLTEITRVARTPTRRSSTSASGRAVLPA